jgi:hypothetical protein
MSVRHLREVRCWKCRSNGVLDLIVLTNKVLLLLCLKFSVVVVVLSEVDITELINILIKAHNDLILLFVLLVAFDVNFVAFRVRLNGFPFLLLLGWHFINK